MSYLLEVKQLEYMHKLRSGIFTKKDSFKLGPISFHLNAGETLAITGNNGSGKTLLAKALVGAFKDQTGQILLNGNLLNTSAPESNNQDIRLILQHSNESINPAIKIGSMLEQTLLLNTDLDYKSARLKIEQTLVSVGLLRDHYHFYKHMLSDGQQQRVSLARALILDPKVVVADEPFAALDPSVRSQTVNLILELQKKLGLSFVFVSQNLGIIRHISDKVLVIDDGKIIESGNTCDVFDNPQQALTKKLIDSHFSLLDNHFEALKK